MYSAKYKYYSTKKYNGFDSKFEGGKAAELDLLKKAGEIVDYKTQVKIPLIVNNYIICNYYMDFVVEHNDGTIEYIECKGYSTEIWKMKWKMFEALYSDKPNVKLTVEYQGKSWKPQRRRVK